MKRLTVENVFNAYEKTGLKPMRGDYFPEDGCACGLGVVAYSHGHKVIADAYYEGAGFHNDYIQAFAAGFDGEIVEWTTDIYTLGYADGKAAWEAVKHLAEESQ